MRAGRHRKQRGFLVERAPIERDGRARSLAQPHRRELPEDQRGSEKAATPLGALNLRRIITDEQHEAGQRYQVVVGEYRASIGAPREGGSAGGGYECKPVVTASGHSLCRSLVCECARRKSAFEAASRALADAGHRAGVAVSQVAVHANPCPYGYLDWLKVGLTALVEHFGLGAQRGWRARHRPYRHTDRTPPIDAIE